MSNGRNERIVSGSTVPSTSVVPARYRTIVADPPWQLPWNINPRRSMPYPTMTSQQIANLPVSELIARDGTERHLYLWTTSMHLFDAKTVLDKWGFAYSATLVWCKSQSPLGGRFPSNLEFILFGRKPPRSPQPESVVEITRRIGEIVREAGFSAADLRAISGLSGAHKWMGASPKCAQIPPQAHWEKLMDRIPELAALNADVAAANAAKGQRRKATRASYPQANSRWFAWREPAAHSQKPEAFLDMVEHVSPGPYLELFARRQRLGWDTWGNEALEHVEMAS